MTATFRYTHSSPTAGDFQRPCAQMRVEVWRNLPSLALVASATTDANGQVSVAMADAVPGTGYFLKIFSWNEAADVRNRQYAWAYPGTQPVHTYTTDTKSIGPPWNLQRNLNWGTIVFSAYDSLEFNVADVIRLGRLYAMARRDPSEADSANIPQVSVQTYLDGYFGAPNFYNKYLDLIHLSYNNLHDDFVILHE